MKSSLIFIFVLLATSVLATDYTTIGNGSWSNGANWDGNGVPPGNLADGDVINVGHDMSGNVTLGSNGTSTINIDNTTNLTSLTLEGSGIINIIVDNGADFNLGTLTVRNGVTVNVNGDMNITGDVNVSGSSLAVSGKLVAGGDLDVANSGANIELNSADISGNFEMRGGASGNIYGMTTIGGDFNIENGNTSLNIEDTGALDVTNNFSVIDASVTGDGVIGWGGTINVQNQGTIGSLSGGEEPTDNPYDIGENGPGILPITLISFSGKMEDSGVILNWATSSEENFHYFSIQKSEDGIHYHEIGRIEGYGSSKIKRDYQFIDKKITKGTTYYRLQSVDFDGYTETFRPIVIESATSSGRKIYPNPAKGYIIINKPISSNFNNSITIYNSYGVKVYTSDQVTSEKLNISHLNHGIYFVKFSDGATYRLIKE